MNNKKKVTLGLLAAALIIALILSLVSCGGARGGNADEQAPQEAAETKAAPEQQEDSSDLCTITIDNGAASANTDQAVNGLHVYDPESEDLDDYVSGTQVPKGTKVAYFAYPVATNVHLTVIHNGQTIVDKDLEKIIPFEEDDKVEHFELVLEGDLIVRTTAIEEDLSGEHKVSINDESLASVYVGSKQLHDGDTLKTDTFTFSVTSKDKAVEVTLQIGGKTVGTYSLKAGGSGVEFKDVKVNKDVSFVLKELPTEKYTVSYGNDTGASLQVRWVDYANNVHDIGNGEQLPEGTEIWARVINTTDRPVAVYGSYGGSMDIGPKPANDDGSYGGIGPIKLSGNLYISVVYTGEARYTVTIDNGTDATLNLMWMDKDNNIHPISSGDQLDKDTTVFVQVINASDRAVKLSESLGGQSAEIPAKPADDDASYGGLSPISLTGSLTVSLTWADEVPKPEYTITINDGAAAASTDELTNGLHVYDRDEKDQPDLKSGTKKPEGTRMCVFAYNLATPVHLTVTMGGETIKDAVYPQREAWVDDDKIEFVEFELTGDLVVTTEVAEAADVTYTVSYEDKVGNEDVQLNVMRMDMSGEAPKPVAIENGEKLPAGEMIYTQVINMGEGTVKVTAYTGDKELGSAQVTAEDMFGGLDPIELSADLRIVLEPAEETPPEDKTFTVSYEDKVGSEDVQLNIMRMDMSGERPMPAPIASGDKLPEGETIFSQVVNSSDKAVKLTAYEGMKVVASAEIPARPADDDASYGGLDPIELKADLRFVLEPAEAEEETYTITINDGAAAANTDSAVNGLHVYTGSEDDYKSGDKAPADTPITVFVYNYASPVHLTVTMGGETIADKTYPIIQSDDDVDFIEFKLTGDLVVTTEVAEAAETTYAVSYEDKIGSEDVALNIMRMDMSGESPAPAPIASGDKLPEGEMVYSQVINSSDKPVKLTAYAGGTEIASAEIPAKPEDDDASYGGLDPIELTADLRFVLEPAEETPPEETSCVVSVDDQVGSEDVQLNIMRMDMSGERPVPAPIASGDKLPEGETIFSQVVNSSDKTLKLTAYEGMKVVASAEIPAKPADDDASYGGLDPIELKADLRFVLEEVKQETPEPEPEETTYTVTVDNAVENVIVNLSWLDMSGESPETVPVASGDKVKENTGLFVQVINDSDKDVTVTALIGGQELEKAEIKAGEAGGLMGEDYSGLALTGDMTVKVEELKTWTVTVDDQVQDENVTFTVGYIVDSDDGPVSVPVESGSKYPDGMEMIGGRVMNDSDKTVKFSVYEGESLSYSAEVAPEGRTGYYVETLTADTRFVLEPVEAASGTVKVHISGPAGEIYDTDSWQTLSDGQELEKGSYGFEVYGNEDVDVKVTVTVNGSVVATETLPAGNSFELSGVELDGDISFVFEEIAEEESTDPEQNTSQGKDPAKEVLPAEEPEEPLPEDETPEK